MASRFVMYVVVFLLFAKPLSLLSELCSETNLIRLIECNMRKKRDPLQSEGAERKRGVVCSAVYVVRG